MGTYLFLFSMSSFYVKAFERFLSVVSTEYDNVTEGKTDETTAESEDAHS